MTNGMEYSSKKELNFNKILPRLAHTTGKLWFTAWRGAGAGGGR